MSQETDGGFTADAIGENIFTQAGAWDELKTNVREAVQAFYFDLDRPVGTPNSILTSVAGHQGDSKEDTLRRV